MSDSYRNKVLVNLGRILMLIGLVYFVQRLVPHTQDIWLLLEGRHIYSHFLLSLITYSVALVVLSQLWLLLLNMSGGNTVRTRLPHSLVYLLTIIAKYLPGNVFQYATRHVLSKKLGLSHKVVALAAIAELALLSATAVLLSIIVISVVMGISGFAGSLPWGGWGRFITPFWISAVLLAMLAISISIAHFIISGAVWQKIKWMVSSYLTASLFFIINFLSLWVLAQLFIDSGELNGFSLAAYLFVGNLIAWLVGMMTPGAPGGLGVKEVVFLAFLSPFIGEPQALGIAVASRLISLAGDCLVSFGAYIATKRNPVFSPKAQG